MVQCPRCGLQVNDLHAIPSEVILRLQSMGENPPQQCCAGCLSDLRKNSQQQAGGGVLLAQERAKEVHRQTLWKSRVNLIKKARMQMNQKQYGDAAISYEKYLKILEIVFELKKGEKLLATHFRDNAKTTEITVVASVYWDLIRIYDTNPKYASRQVDACKQLASFVRFTPIFPDIIRKAEHFQKSAKNSGAIKNFIKQAQSHKGYCFIATAAFENPLAYEVNVLRDFRDQVLRKYWLGRVFIFIYYQLSPPVAQLIKSSPKLKKLAKAALRVLIKRIS